MAQKLRFFDSVQTKSKFDNLVEDYFYLGRTFKKWKYKEYILTGSYHLIDRPNRIRFAKRVDKIYAVAIDLLKMLSYFTIVIPIAVLLRKHHFRRHLTIKPFKKPSVPGRKPHIPQPLNFTRKGTEIKVRNDKKKLVRRYIPPEILSRILDYAVNDLGNKQKVEALTKYASVNKSFYHASHSKIDHLLDQNPEFNIPRGFLTLDEYIDFVFTKEFTKLDFSNTRVSDNDLINIANKYPEELKTIETLVIKQDEDKKVLTDSGFISLIKKCPNLKHLDISDTKFTESALLDIAVYAKKLTSLNLAFTKLKDVTLEHLVKGLDQLDSLNISYCNGFSDSGFTNALSHMTQLTKLEIANFQGVLNKDTISLIPQKLLKLEHINVAGTSARKEFFSLAAQNLLNLISLDISHTKVEDDDIKELANNLVKLENLTASFCTKLTDKTDDYIAEGFTSLKRLQLEAPYYSSLHVGQNPYLSTKGLEKIAKNHPDLRELVVFGRHLKQNWVESVIQHLTKLRKLDTCDNSKNNSKTGLIKIFKNLKNLEYLNYKYHKDSLGIDLPRLKKHTPNLRWLDIINSGEHTKDKLIDNTRGLEGVSELSLWISIDYSEFQELLTNIQTIRSLRFTQSIGVNKEYAKMICSSLPYLEKLEIFSSNISPESLKYFGKYTKRLRKLIIRTDDNFRTIQKMAQSIKYPGLIIKVRPKGMPKIIKNQLI